ncbi:hypothetical protein BHE74_00008828 [Ensete ventricosum]|nr:hypothetical protein BHE74_00008828 [Ensete ventricosum]
MNLFTVSHFTSWLKAGASAVLVTISSSAKVLKFDLEKALAKDREANNLNWGRPSEQGRGSTPPLFRKWPCGRLILESTFGPLGELQSLEVCCDVIEGVVRTRLEDLAWLTFMSEVSLFASTSFFSPADALVFCTKAVVQG